MNERKTALITGASSGIGRALAVELARRGYDLGLLARRTDLLEELAAEVQRGGVRAFAYACDVTDRASVSDAVARLTNDLGHLDLVVANAGLSIPGHATKFDMDVSEQIIRVNLLGMIYVFDSVIGKMIERRRGRFVGVASVAGLRGLPTAASYSASKAAMQAFLEASRVELAPYGVGVTIVNPGFVATPMTEKNRFRMPFLIQPDEAAVTMADGIEAGSRVVEFPRPMSILMRLARAMPDAIWDRFAIPAGRRKKVAP